MDNITNGYNIVLVETMREKEMDKYDTIRIIPEIEDYITIAYDEIKRQARQKRDLNKITKNFNSIEGGGLMMLINKEIKMNIDKQEETSKKNEKEEMEKKLDEALIESFPASDPVSLFIPVKIPR